MKRSILIVLLTTLSSLMITSSFAHCKEITVLLVRKFENYEKLVFDNFTHDVGTKIAVIDLSDRFAKLGDLFVDLFVEELVEVFNADIIWGVTGLEAVKLHTRGLAHAVSGSSFQKGALRKYSIVSAESDAVAFPAYMSVPGVCTREESSEVIKAARWSDLAELSFKQNLMLASPARDAASQAIVLSWFQGQGGYHEGLELAYRLGKSARASQKTNAYLLCKDSLEGETSLGLSTLGYAMVALDKDQSSRSPNGGRFIVPIDADPIAVTYFVTPNKNSRRRVLEFLNWWESHGILNLIDNEPAVSIGAYKHLKTKGVIVGTDDWNMRGGNSERFAGFSASPLTTVSIERIGLELNYLFE